MLHPGTEGASVRAKPIVVGVRVLLAAVAAASVALAVALGCAGVAEAAVSGSLDSTFGSGGVASLAPGTQLFGVAVQPNGEVVAAGQSGGSVLVQRFGTGGQPDGRYVGAAGYARGLAVQSNGDIVIAGLSRGAMFVERLTSGLTPDSSFGSNGIATAPVGGMSAVANGVAIGPGGSIVAAGTVTPPVTQVGTQAGVAEFSSSGAVAWSKTLSLGGLFSVANGVAVQPNGDIVLVGNERTTQDTSGVVARLTGSGALDATFAGTGMLTYRHTASGGGYTSLNAVGLQSNGQIVAAGVDAGGPNALVLRINSNGGLDSSFGSGGVAHQPSGQNISAPGNPIGAYGVAISTGTGGQIVAAGNFENTGTEIDAALYAFMPTGSPDTNVGGTGAVRAPTGAIEACALAIAPNNDLVVAGDTVTAFPDATPCTVNSSSAGFAARYNALNGSKPPPPPPPPPLKVSLKANGSYKKARVKNGLKFSVGCNQTCGLRVTLTASAAIAKKLHIGKKVRTCKKVHGHRRCTTVVKYSAITISSQQATILNAGTKTFVINNRLFRRALGTFPVVPMRLNVTGSPTKGKSVSTTKVITFKR